ncbi:MAG: ABC transporter transmembrane domain-containing protein [Eubacteriales bacterium]
MIIDSIKNLVFILRYLEERAVATFFSLIVFTGVGLTRSLPYVYKLLIDSFTKGTASGEIGIKFILIVVTYIVLIITNELISHLKEYVNQKLGMRMSHSFSLMYIEKFRDIDLKYLDDPEFADIAARSRSDANLHPEELLFQFIDILENLISVAAYSVVVIRYSPLFMLFCVVSLVITFFNYKENEEKRFSWEKNATSARRMSDYFDSVQKKREYIPEVRLFGLSSYFEDKYQASQRELLKNDLKLDLHERASDHKQSDTRVGDSRLSVISRVSCDNVENHARRLHLSRLRS